MLFAHQPSLTSGDTYPTLRLKSRPSNINIHCPKSNPFYLDTERCFQIRQPATHPKWKDCDQDEHDYLSGCISYQVKCMDWEEVRAHMSQNRSKKQMLHSSGRSSSAQIRDRDVLVTMFAKQGREPTAPREEQMHHKNLLGFFLPSLRCPFCWTPYHWVTRVSSKK